MTVGRQMGRMGRCRLGRKKEGPLMGKRIGAVGRVAGRIDRIMMNMGAPGMSWCRVGVMGVIRRLMLRI